MVGKHWIEGQTEHFLTGQELKNKKEKKNKQKDEPQKDKIYYRGYPNFAQPRGPHWQFAMNTKASLSFVIWKRLQSPWSLIWQVGPER